MDRFEPPQSPPKRSVIATRLPRRARLLGASSAARGIGDAGLDLRKLLIRQLPPLGIFALLGVLLWDKLHALDTAHILAALATVGPGQWALGLLLTGISFWALGQYDVVVHRLLGLDTTAHEASRTGMTAIAVAQTIGMGAVTSTFVRWRLLPNVSLLDATRISAVVAISFLAAWAVVSALSVLVFGAAIPGAGLIATLVLIGAFAFVGLSIWRMGVLAHLPLPSAKSMGLIFGFTAIDTFAAAGVLWAMLPPEISMSPTEIFTAYLLALGAGLVLTTPGGVGPFEVALLALLPHMPEEPLLAAVIAYRALYYVLPALLGAIVLIRGPLARSRARAPLPQLSTMNGQKMPLLLDALIENAPRAEAALLRHGRFDLLSDRKSRPTALAARSAQTLIMLGDPLRRDANTQDVVADLTTRAKQNLLAPALYKCGARLAVAARRKGWSVLPIAREAFVVPADFSEQGAARRQLRRKLRKAEGAGLTLSAISPFDPTPLPLDDMEALARAWAEERGGERGFSMGVFATDTLPHAHIYLAHDAEGVLQGFITVHGARFEHTLDLMRISGSAPDGTMHLLVREAIKGAAQADAARFSFAAVPLGTSENEPKALTKLRERLDTVTGAAGLRQFKSAFGPRWETLYFAAPTKSALALAALDVYREIKRPPPTSRRAFFKRR